MKKIKLLFTGLFLSATLSSCNGPLSPETAETLDTPLVQSAKPARISFKPLVQFHDHFEARNTWGIFEEIVGGSPCYGDGIGEVAIIRGVAQNGRRSLRAWSNQKNSLKSNHVLANNQISNFGQTGIYRYEVEQLWRSRCLSVSGLLR